MGGLSGGFTGSTEGALNGWRNGSYYVNGIKQNPNQITVNNNSGGLSTYDKAQIGLSTVGGLGQLGLGIWNAVEQNKINQANSKLIQEQIQYQKDLNALQMHREDTAYQRTMKDLQAAGINPIVAVDAGATGTGSYSGTQFQESGQKATNLQNLIQALDVVMTTGQNLANLEQTQAQNRLIEEEILNRQSNRSLMDSQNFLNQLISAKTDEEKKRIIQERLNAELDYKMNLHDYQLNTRYDIRSNDALMQEFNTLKATIQEFMNSESMTRNIIDPIIEYFKETMGQNTASKNKPRKGNYGDEGLGQSRDGNLYLYP